jgi:hypothetical protein
MRVMLMIRNDLSCGLREGRSLFCGHGETSIRQVFGVGVGGRWLNLWVERLPLDTAF